MDRKVIFCVAVVLAVALMATRAEGSEQGYDYIKRCRDESRRRLPEYIEWLHSKDPPMPYEFIVLRISWSEDPRAIEPMMEVLADTSIYIARAYDPYVTAAKFLARMGAKQAIPVLKENLTLMRHFERPSWNNPVHLACAAALFELGELQDALPVFKKLLWMGDSEPSGGVPVNADEAIYTPLDAYRNRPEALDTIYEFFREATKSNVPTVRAGAAERLVGVDNNLALTTAEEVLTHDRNLLARLKAVDVAKAIGNPQAKRVLEMVVKNDPNELVKQAAQTALQEMSRGEER